MVLPHRVLWWSCLTLHHCSPRSRRQTSTSLACRPPPQCTSGGSLSEGRWGLRQQQQQQPATVRRTPPAVPRTRSFRVASVSAAHTCVPGVRYVSCSACRDEVGEVLCDAQGHTRLVPGNRQRDSKTCECKCGHLSKWSLCRIGPCRHSPWRIDHGARQFPAQGVRFGLWMGCSCQHVRTDTAAAEQQDYCKPSLSGCHLLWRGVRWLQQMGRVTQCCAVLRCAGTTFVRFSVQTQPDAEIWYGKRAL